MRVEGNKLTLVGEGKRVRLLALNDPLPVQIKAARPRPGARLSPAAARTIIIELAWLTFDHPTRAPRPEGRSGKLAFAALLFAAMTFDDSNHRRVVRLPTCPPSCPPKL